MTENSYIQRKLAPIGEEDEEEMERRRSTGRFAKMRFQQNTAKQNASLDNKDDNVSDSSSTRF